MRQKPPSISFRRFLLSRLLLLTLPMLLLGVGITYFFTYRKARSALLETARQNLTESAIRYGDQLTRTVNGLTSNLLLASQTLRYAPDPQTVLTQLSAQLPATVHCLQAYQVSNQSLTASTCGSTLLKALPAATFPQREPIAGVRRQTLYIEVVLDPERLANRPQEQTRVAWLNQTNTLTLLIASPIYRDQQLDQVLLAQVDLTELASRQRSSLVGAPMIINQDYQILAHPYPEQVGRSVFDVENDYRLESLVKNALSGRTTFSHLFSLSNGDQELLAGYTAIASPLPQEPNQQWVIVAFTQLDSAIAEVHSIRVTLLILLVVTTFGLILTSTVVMLYVARATARPVEKLRDLVLDEQEIYREEKIPYTSNITELNQLTDAVNSLIRRLISWMEELEGAWQEARRANQLKNEFLANISDEFRTPLNGLIGSLQILQDHLYESPEEEQEFLEIATEKTLRVKELIDNMLTLSLLERGQTEVDLEQISLPELLQQAIATYESAAHHKHLELDFVPLPTEKIWIHGDRQKLLRVFNIVLENAIKFTETGTITIAIEIQSEVHATIHTPSGQVARVLIADPGVGIPPDRLAYLFQPFIIADGAKNSSHRGAGLGLAIARNFMDLMGGNIVLDSPGAGQGTTVYVDLPLARKVDLEKCQPAAVQMKSVENS